MPAGRSSKGQGFNGKWVHLFLNNAFRKLSVRGEISPVGHSEPLTTAVKFLFCFVGKELTLRNGHAASYWVIGTPSLPWASVAPDPHCPSPWTFLWARPHQHSRKRWHSWLVRGRSGAHPPRLSSAGWGLSQASPRPGSCSRPLCLLLIPHQKIPEAPRSRHPGGLVSTFQGLGALN